LGSFRKRRIDPVDRRVIAGLQRVDGTVNNDRQQDDDVNGSETNTRNNRLDYKTVPNLALRTNPQLDL
jgi:hypothetical protein